MLGRSLKEVSREKKVGRGGGGGGQGEGVFKGLVSNLRRVALFLPASIFFLKKSELNEIIDHFCLPGSRSSLSIKFNCGNTQAYKSREKGLLHVGKLLESHVLYNRGELQTKKQQHGKYPLFVLSIFNESQN